MILVRKLAWRVGAPARLALIGLIRVYRVTLAGLLGGQCRFHPSCSHYAEQAIRRVGAVRGTGLAAWRILRCSPLSAGGVDPAPLGTRYDDDIRPAVEAVPSVQVRP